MVVISDILNNENNNDDEAAASAAAAVGVSLPQQSHRPSCLYTRSTTTTEQQIQTEMECGQYLDLLIEDTATADSGTSHSDHLDYFLSRGLIVNQQIDYYHHHDEDAVDDHIDSDDDDIVENNANNQSKYAVRLLRDAHAEYLHTIFRDEPHKLRPSFVSLDSSHTWMIYWCLHGLDLLGKVQTTTLLPSHDGIDHKEQQHQTDTPNDANNVVPDDSTIPIPMDDDIIHTIHPRTKQRILRTIQSCFTTIDEVSMTREIVTSDPILVRLFQQQQQNLRMPSNIASDDDPPMVTFHNGVAGGFGGGPHQLPHAATTYAAVMSLCILASSSSSTADHETNEAFDYLLSIRTSLYVFFASLYNPINGSFRMHLDGEMDVRATYCVYSVLHLLQMIPSTTHSTAPSSLFTNPQISNYIWSCQSQWEGGFGGEPGAEAHGGYTYCAVAALYLFRTTKQKHGNTNVTTASPECNNSSRTLDDNAIHKLELCSTWLRQRQMSYEGGFSGRINKLVDGCYSFWQGAASVIIHEQLQQLEKQQQGIFENDTDPWLRTKLGTATTLSSGDVAVRGVDEMDCDPFNAVMLQRYILLCTQDENGGLRDKPSKGRDFYHSCYCLSGLSIAQHYGGKNKSRTALSTDHTKTHQTHPCYNIRVEHVAFCQSYFSQCPI